jgi:flavin reductase (DIM6/NTAB) family NADH-FMN oxidoreductase RutF
VWLSKKNYTYRVAKAAELLAVHVPTARERDLAALFGSQTGFSVDKFSRCAWRTGPHGVPLLSDCPQWFVGRVLERFDTGDHEGHLIEPVAVSEQSGLGQLNFHEVRDLEPGNDA